MIHDCGRHYRIPEAEPGVGASLTWTGSSRSLTISFGVSNPVHLVDWRLDPPAQKKPGILGKDSGRLDETMRIGEDGIVISQSKKIVC